VTLYERLAALELEVSGYRTARVELPVSSGFTRACTGIVLEGGGVEGRGEDVTYDAEDHDDFPAGIDLSGAGTLGEASRLVGGADLFPARPPVREVSRAYRRWAFESALLDLALRQASLSLGSALGRAYRPVRFVVSTRLDIRPWLDLDPSLEFKLDPTAEWERETMEAIAATGRVRVLDFKAYYTGTIVDQDPDPGLYRSCIELFPDAILEDAALDDGVRETLRGAEGRLSFDAPIHSLADVDSLPVELRFVNIKPSRFGSLERLLECIETCDARGTTMYGGGQFELGVGRGQIQALASLFYAGSPNDVAPAGYNSPEPQAGLTRSPLEPPHRPIGFGWESAT
jgi:hypothetical protein